jgi:hypothetical protein
MDCGADLTDTHLNRRRCDPCAKERREQSRLLWQEARAHGAAPKRVISSETRARMSAARQGKRGGKRTPETRAKIAAAWTPERRAALVAQNKNLVLSDDARRTRDERLRRLALAKKGQPNLALLSRPLSPEHRAKTLEQLSKNWEVRRGSHQSSETRTKISNANRGRVHRRSINAANPKWPLETEVTPLTSGCWVVENNARGRAPTQSHRSLRRFFEYPLLPGYEFDHVCPGGPNPLCVNPNHIDYISHAEHVRRSALIKVAKGWFTPEEVALIEARRAESTRALELERLDRSGAWQQEERDAIEEVGISRE